MSELDSLFEEEAAETTETVEEVAEEVEQAEEPEGEPEEQETEEPEAEPPAAEPEKEEPWTKKAVLDERRKRQEYEAKLKEYEAKLKELEGKKEAPDVFEDSEGYTKYIQQTMTQQMQNQQLNMSEFLARKEYPDLDEKVARFEQMAQENPQIAQEVFSSPSPYHALVDVVKKAEEFDQMKDIDSYKSKLREELRAELLAEIEGTQAKVNKGRETAKKVPKSLAGQGSAGASTTDVVDEALTDILGR